MTDISYSWQSPEWPNFQFDLGQIQAILYDYAIEAGRVAGGMNQVSSLNRSEAVLDLMVDEAIRSSQIEGENLDREDVRSSIKNHLGLQTPPKRIGDVKAEGMAALMVDVRKVYESPLTAKKLHHWHNMVMPRQENLVLTSNIKVGDWRDEPMQIVSGPIGYETVHYEAPPPETVPAEMDRFLEWYNETSPTAGQRPLAGPVRAAIAHLWFESIHPYDDGNGRVGRAIAEHALSQDLGQPLMMALSSSLSNQAKDYHQQLNDASVGNLDVTPWVKWFSEATLTAQQTAGECLQFVLDKSRFWDNHADTTLNDRQVKAVNRIFKEGPNGFENGINAQKYKSITGCSKASATRDLADLVEKGALVRLPGEGRNARYGLALDE